LIDVREMGEWDSGHLRDASFLPLSTMADKVTAKSLEKLFGKGTILYLHCGSGRRVLKAADILNKTGYDVRPLSDGYESLLKAGFPKADGK
jgi:rhodanese-related sulfurtransferase